MPPGACSRKNLPSMFRIGVSFDDLNCESTVAFAPTGIFTPRPTILLTRKNGTMIAVSSTVARIVPVRKPNRSSCRRLIRPMSPATVVSVCGRITYLAVRRVALARGRHRPRRKEIHARPAHGRTHDREHEIHGD